MTIKKFLCLSFIVFVFSMCVPSGAVNVEYPERVEIASLAVSIVKGMSGPYSDITKYLSPAVYPDEIDYLLHEPLDIDISIPFDSFKSDYCASVPSRGKIEPVYDEPVFIESWKKSFRKDGVKIADKKLVSAIAGSVIDFQPGSVKNVYKYKVDITRKATVQIAAKIVSGEADAKEPECAEPWISMEFVEHGGRWWLYSVKRRDRDACITASDDMKIGYKSAAPLYENCAGAKK